MEKEKVIEQILYLEWKMMISIPAIDDPEGCREDPFTFKIMRESQHLVWSNQTLSSYLADLQTAENQRVRLSPMLQDEVIRRHEHAHFD